VRPIEDQLSPELETLDQLLTGDLSLGVIRKIFPSDSAFLQGVDGLVHGGDAMLCDNGTEVPRWQLRELFAKGANVGGLGRYTLRLTAQGARKIA